MRYGKIGIVATIWMCGLAGCASPEAKQDAPAPPPMTMQALYTDQGVNVDGKFDDAVWSRATVYAMKLPADRAARRQLQNAGRVQLAWDDTYFYVAVRFDDPDLVAEGEKDQLHHYRLGDLLELFLKPEKQTWYWELYATPRGKKTTFWFPGRGRLGLPSGFERYQCGLQVAALCEGTLNEWQDEDTGWTAEMAMPIRDLTARGETFGPEGQWRILVARYNYSRYLPYQGAELSSVPQLPVANFHSLEDYAWLKLVK